MEEEYDCGHSDWSFYHGWSLLFRKKEGKVTRALTE
jgi:hypothetical protein